MNGLKIRKLAAVVAGAALLGTAVAPMASAALTSADVQSVVYDSSMSPIVNVVVGQNAQVSDAVWAGNIARKVVEKAVKTVNSDDPVAGNGGLGTAVVSDLAATLTIGGTVTVTGAKTFDSVALTSNGSGQEYRQDIGKDPLTFLTDKSVAYKYNGSSTTIDVKETIGVKLNAKFDTDNDVKDLVADVDAGDINYTLYLGAGIPTGSTAASTADFTDESDDNIRVPFYGKNYLVQKVDVDSSRNVVEIRLIEDKSKQTFSAGDTFVMQGKGQYVGQELTIKIAGVQASGPAASAYQGKFNLYDPAGSLIDTQTVTAGNFVEFEDATGDEVVSGDIYLDSATLSTGTNEGSVDVLVGTSSVRLLDGQNYPYNEDVDEENLNGPYQVTLIETTDTNKLTYIVVKNALKSSITNPDTAAETLVNGWPRSVFDDDNPFFSTDDSLSTKGKSATAVSSFTWLDGTGALGENFFKVSFEGFKEDEENSYVQIGNNEIEFRDAQDSSHVTPFWIKLPETDTTTFSNGVSFSYDNGSKTLYYDVNKTAQDFNVTDGTLLNGVAVDYDGGTGIITTDLGATDLNGSPAAITIRGVTYTVVGDANFANGNVTLRADGWVRFAKASLNTSTATSDLLNGLGGATNVIKAPGGMTAAQLANVFFYDDTNITSNGTNGIATNGPQLPLSGDNYFVNYGIAAIEADATLNSQGADEGIYLLLAGGITTANSSGTGQPVPTAGGIQNSKQLTFFGTDTGEVLPLDTNVYVPQISDLGQDSSSETVYSAWFGLDENNTSSYTIRTYIDTRDDEIPQLGGSGNKISVPTVDVNYGRNIPGVNGISLSLTTDTTNSSALTEAYTDWGTRMAIRDGETAEFWMPENRPEVTFRVSGQSSTSEVSGGESLTVAKGETAEFTTGTKVTVEDITYTASVVAAGTTPSPTVTTGTTAGFSYVTPAPLNGKAMVYTTASTPAGPKIIVGGHLVNNLASGVADRLVAAGDKVAEVSGSNVVVAGYSAADTGAAAQMLIDALEAI